METGLDGPIRFIDPGLITGRVAEALREAIISGRLTPGTRIRERELVATLGISRSPLREAIRILEGEGLITSLPHRGSRVSELTAKDFREINEARIMLEAFAVRLALERLDAHTLGALETHVQKARRAAPNLRGAQDFRLALSFHDIVVHSCGNSRIVQLYEQLKSHLLRYHQFAVSRLGRDLRAIDEHQALVAALRRRDLARFEQLLTQHLRRVTDDLAPLFAAAPASAIIVAPSPDGRAKTRPKLKKRQR